MNSNHWRALYTVTFLVFAPLYSAAGAVPIGLALIVAAVIASPIRRNQ